MGPSLCLRRPVAASLLVLVLPSLAFAQAQAPQGAPSPPVEYAQLYVKLTQLSLQQALQANQQAPNTIPKGQIAVLKARVALAEAWAQAAQGNPNGNARDTAVLESQVIEKAAEENYQSALKINAISPMNPIALEKLRVKLELARLRVKIARQLDPNAPLALMQYHLQRLQEDVSELAADRLRAMDLD